MSRLSSKRIEAITKFQPWRKRLSQLQHSESPTAPPKKSRSHGHNDALDGVRFFSFLAVFLAHAGTFSEFGSYGVRVFFVLSGFLIGRILLNLRSMDGSLRHKLGTFYARRTLRIFPLYYLVLTIVWLLPHLGITALGVSHAIPWQFLYLNNFYQFFVAMPGTTGHFWTLAIEEQFYLIAPFIILVMPTRLISVGIVLLWMFDLLFYVPHLIPVNPGMAFLLPNVQFAFISMGLAAAYVQTSDSFLGAGRKTFYAIGSICAAIAIAMPYLLRKKLLSGAYFPVFEWSLCVASASAFLALWSNRLRWLGLFLSLAPLAYLGRISYGLYVYHSFILHATTDHWGGSRKIKVVAFVISIAVAMVSWHLFEKPINNLKRFFPYRDAKASAGS